MNQAYRLVWNPSQQCYVPAPETARGHHKQGGRIKGALVSAAVAIAFMGVASGAYALPTGGQVSSGAGSVAQSGPTLTVNQASQRLALNWQSFNIAGNETVTYAQPNASAVALNRVLGNDASAIYGKLNANGQVFLINPNGILFGKDAQVNVGGLLASTLKLSDADFLNGKRAFSGNGGSNGSVTNLGYIKADGGYIAFLGGQVSNQGTLQANLGTVALAAGQQVTLSFNKDNLISVQVDQGAFNALAENRQVVQADGGTVILTAKAADQLVSAVVNNSGLIRARTLQSNAGIISLVGDMQNGQVNVGGTLDVSVDTGAPKGSQAGSITASAAQVNVNDVATWSAGTLTLKAQRNININADLNASGAASLVLQYGLGAVAAGNTGNYTLNNGAQVNLPSGSNFSTKLGSDGSAIKYTVINRLGVAGDSSGKTLQGIKGNLSASYVLGGNIDATDSAGWNGNAGFAPIGNKANAFSGTFDGLGHTITGLTITRPAVDYVGLFGYLLGGAVQNVGLVGGSVSGGSIVGGLLGYSNYGTISNAYATDSVTGGNWVGGLVGYNNYGTISNAYASGSVTGTSWIGGLLGANYGTVNNTYATGSVSGSNWAGGLVGVNESGTIGNAYATGSVRGGAGVGGLVGVNDSGAIGNVYATGSVSGESDVGGLVGWNYGGTIKNGYWDTATSGRSTSAGGIGLSTEQMRTGANFAGFNFTTSPGAAGWLIVDGDGSLNNAQGIPGATTPMLAFEYSTRLGNAHQLQLMALAPAASYIVDGNIDVSATATGKDVWGKAGFGAVGNSSAPFTGAFDGGGHVLNGLTINAPTISNTGLFGTVGSGGSVQNVGLVGSSVSGSSDVGGLAGVNKGTISNAYASGKISGKAEVGGLVGRNEGSVIKAYATTGVSGESDVGGLAGVNLGKISNAYATGNVAGKAEVGGLAGKNIGAISDVYARGSVGGDTYVGGLVGVNQGTLSNAYATGSVSGGGSGSGSTIGGLIGDGSGGKVSNGFWDTATSGRSTSAGGTGLSTVEMQTQNSFSQALDFRSTWVMYDGRTYPLLRTFMVPLTVTAKDVTKTYDGQEFLGSNATYSLKPNSLLLGVLGYGGTAQGASDVGTYTITPGGLYSTQQQGGYAIDFVSGALTVNPATLTVFGTMAASKVYRGNTKAKMTSSLSGVVAGDMVNLIQIGNFADENVGTDKIVTYSNTLAGKDAHNYVLSALSAKGGTVEADIIARALTVVGTTVAVNKIYDGTTTASLSGGSLNGLITGDAVTLIRVGTFATKNVGDGIAVTAKATLSGASAGNYTLIQPTDPMSANITPKAVTVVGTVAANKVYDGGTSASLSGGSGSGLISGDDVKLVQSGMFATKNVGTGIAVGVTSSLAGAAANNYTLVDSINSLVANITPKQLAVSGTMLAADKVYDGTTITEVSGGNASGIVAGDKVSFTQMGNFADKNASTTKKAVTYKNSLTGADAGNYSLSSTAGTTSNKATIKERPLTVTGTVAADKAYNGTANATLSGTGFSGPGFVAGDAVSLVQVGRFSNMRIGTGITVNYTNSLTGTDAGNYSLTATRGTTTASIYED